jgi:hypothetical protein
MASQDRKETKEILGQQEVPANPVLQAYLDSWVLKAREESLVLEENQE